MSSPQRAGAFVSASVIELSSRRRGTRLSESPSRLSESPSRLSESPSRLSETPWPERRAWARVRAGWVFTSLLFYVWHAIDGVIV